MKKILCCLLIVCCLCGCGARSASADVRDTNGDGKLTCTLEIRCDTLLSNMDKLTQGKADLVPEDGLLLAATEVTFRGGDSVFDVFRQVLRQEKIHFEYTDAQLYGSVYIEGIGNLYEFDCGPRSGWMFSVNDAYPGLGCSAYTLADGDVIRFSYTCDLGQDLGVDYEK